MSALCLYRPHRHAVILACQNSYAKISRDTEKPRISKAIILPSIDDDIEGELTEGLVGWSLNDRSGNSINDDKGNNYYRKISGTAKYGWFISGYGVKRSLNLSDNDPNFGFIPNALPGKRMVSLCVTNSFPYQI